jgi:hypothetical protein
MARSRIALVARVLDYVAFAVNIVETESATNASLYVRVPSFIMSFFGQ